MAVYAATISALRRDHEFTLPVAVRIDPAVGAVKAAVSGGLSGRSSQARTQVMSWRVSPNASRRRRFTAATRWCSHWSLAATPR